MRKQVIAFLEHFPKTRILRKVNPAEGFDEPVLRAALLKRRHMRRVQKILSGPNSSRTAAVIAAWRKSYIQSVAKISYTPDPWTYIPGKYETIDGVKTWIDEIYIDHVPTPEQKYAELHMKEFGDRVYRDFGKGVQDYYCHCSFLLSPGYTKKGPLWIIQVEIAKWTPDGKQQMPFTNRWRRLPAMFRTIRTKPHISIGFNKYYREPWQRELLEKCKKRWNTSMWLKGEAAKSGMIYWQLDDNDLKSLHLAGGYGERYLGHMSLSTGV